MLNSFFELFPFEILHYNFVQNALIGSFFVVIICAVAGVLVVVNRNTYLVGGVSHASYGGIGLAIWLGLSPLIGAMAVALAAGVVLGSIRQNNSAKADSLVSALWASGMAAGILLSDLTPGYSADYLTYLFGDLLLISDTDLIVLAIIALISVILIIKYYKIILYSSADPAFAHTLGINVGLVNRLMLVYLCMAVVALMKMSGLILVMALLSMPASIAETRVKKLSSMMILSGIIAFCAMFLGTGLSIKYNLTPGALTVIVLTIIYAFNFFKKK